MCVITAYSVQCFVAGCRGSSAGQQATHPGRGMLHNCSHATSLFLDVSPADLHLTPDNQQQSTAHHIIMFTKSVFLNFWFVGREGSCSLADPSGAPVTQGKAKEVTVLGYKENADSSVCVVGVLRFGRADTRTIARIWGNPLPRQFTVSVLPSVLLSHSVSWKLMKMEGWEQEFVWER